MANPWFRLYHEFATDPKVQMLSEVDQRRFIMLLCLRCSNDDVTLHDDEVAFQLRISSEEFTETKRRLMAKELIDKTNQPIAWEKRQFSSDSSTARVKAFREKKKTGEKRQCNVTETKSNALDTDTDTDTDTDKKNNHVADSGESSADENKKPKFTDADRELAIHMLAAVQKISPSMKAAKSWPDDIRLMRERDNHTLGEIREMFDWANADPFWSANILSPGKLRDKWAQLEAQRNRPKLAVVNGKQSAHGGFEHIDYTKGINADGSF